MENVRNTRKCKAKSTVTQEEGSTPKPLKKGKKKKPNSPAKAENNVALTIELLPDEIILCIIHFLAPYHLVKLSLTSSRYRNLVGTLPRFRNAIVLYCSNIGYAIVAYNPLWKEIYRRQWTLPRAGRSEKHRDWKGEYVRRGE